MQLWTNRSKRSRWLAAALVFSAAWATGQGLAAEAWRLENSGDAEQALRRLRDAATSAPNDAAALRAYAEFLDEHRDPAAREAYARLSQVLERTGAPAEQRAEVAQRLAVLDLLAGDREASARDLQAYSAAGGKDLALPPPRTTSAAQLHRDSRAAAFLRAHGGGFAGLNPNDLLAALARNVVTNGYQATTANEALEQTEYLKLVIRYLSQARELEKLAGPDKMIRIEMCESPATADLLRVLGFRMRGGCGSDLVLETVNASRAFLTIDSGFPLAELEQALRTNRPFTLDYHPTRVPVLYTVRLLAVAQKTRSAGRIYRLLPVRSVAVPAVSGAVQAGSGDRGPIAQGMPVGAAEDLCARAGLLRRHVRDPRRQSGGSGRSAQRESMGRPERRRQPG